NLTKAESTYNLLYVIVQKEEWNMENKNFLAWRFVLSSKQEKNECHTGLK
ncbi:hypothetical protein IRJ41_012177, partial [Triplophysa rosa]